MAKNAKPKINAEAAYENAHLVAQDLVTRIGHSKIRSSACARAKRSTMRPTKMTRKTMATSDKC